ncbi:hypothetical protein E5H83_23895 [Escherichia coli]|nr:hypothetical protein [Escherichia coli]EFC2200120.1 hypothetical protein [Escherichia coli]EFX4609524.1 hypothetical protein [Shigella flexneri]MXD82814.1 hypothetical protein [Escherichia coli]HAH2843227.1 hypothetical protein [Escherichia coli]
MTAHYSFIFYPLPLKLVFFTSPSHSALRLFLTLQGKVPDQYKMQVRIERYIANNLMKPNVFFFLSKKQYFQFF